MKAFWKKHSGWILPTITGIMIILLWYGIGNAMAASYAAANEAPMEEAQQVRQITLPFPHEILNVGEETFGNLIKSATKTASYAITGFICAIIVGYGTALLLSSATWVYKSLYPWVLVLQMTPVVVLAPIFAIWLESEGLTTTFITFMIGFFPVAANTTMGLLSTDRNLLDLFRMTNATKAQELFLLRIPYAMPYFLTGMKIAGTLAVIGAITGDIFVGSLSGGVGGLGVMVILYKSQLDTPALFATAGVACVLGFIFVGFVNYLHWLFLHNWHDSMVKAEK